MKNPKLTQEALKQSIDSLSVALNIGLNKAYDVILAGLAYEYKGKIPKELQSILENLSREICK